MVRTQQPEDLTDSNVRVTLQCLGHEVPSTPYVSTCLHNTPTGQLCLQLVFLCPLGNLRDFLGPYDQGDACSSEHSSEYRPRNPTGRSCEEAPAADHAAGGVLSPKDPKQEGTARRCTGRPTYMCRDFCAFTTSSFEL